MRCLKLLGAGGLAVALALVGLPAVASADTWCVTPATGCDSTHTLTGLQSALTAAGANPGPDTIVLGVSTYSSSGYTYAGGATNPVTIQGAGEGLTTLATNATGQTLFTESGGTSATIENLTAAIDGGTSGGLGFSLDGPSDAISGVSFVDGTTGGDEVEGVLESGGSLTMTGSDLDLGSQSGDAVTLAAGSHAQLADDTIVAYIGVNMTNSSLRMDRTSLAVTAGGISLTGLGAPTDLYLDDSLLRSTTSSGAAQLVSATDLGGAGVTTVIRHDTLVDAGIGILVEELSAGTASTTVDSTAISGVGTSIDVLGVGGGPAPVSIDYSDYDPASVQAFGDAPITPGAGNLDDVDPDFTSSSAGDYHLAAASPLIDAGNPTLDPAESTTDLDGNPRVVAAQGGCKGVSDIGAYEFQHYQPVAAATATPTAVQTGQPATFDASASCDSAQGVALSDVWRFDDGTSATGATVQHAFSTPGTHTATVTVTDPGHASATKSVQVAVTAAPATSQSTTSQSTTSQSTTSQLTTSQLTTLPPAPGAATPPPFAGVVLGTPRIFLLAGNGWFPWTLGCPAQSTGGCTGTLTIVAPWSAIAHASRAAHGRGQAKTVTIAILRFRLAPGQTKRFTIKLSRAAASVLRRTGHVKASATVVVSDGAAEHATGHAAITLKRARSKR